jgi:Na+/H+ antiporter NhaA
MTLFFFLVSLELKRELVLGELNNPRMAALSVAAALGGMLVPAALYLTLQSGLPGQHGWGTAMATDTAFVIGSLALLGSRIPQSLRVFMLSLAIVDDIGAILVVAFGYSTHIAWGALALAGRVPQRATTRCSNPIGGGVRGTSSRSRRRMIFSVSSHSEEEQQQVSPAGCVLVRS